MKLLNNVIIFILFLPLSSFSIEVSSAYTPRINLSNASKNELISEKVQHAVLSLSLKYSKIVKDLDARTLRWFLYTMIHRESSFNTGFCNLDDGIPSDSDWSFARPGSVWPTRDHLPHGCGLTQITGWIHGGIPYPNNLKIAPQKLNKGIYGFIKPPVEISELKHPNDETQNIERFITEEVLPDYILIKKTYPEFSKEEILRAVAFHWNMGEYVQYNPNHESYFLIYDEYVNFYKPIVLADAWPDGDLNREPVQSFFAIKESSSQYWIEMNVGPVPAESVSVSIDGAESIPLRYRNTNTWYKKINNIVSGSKLVFTAKINNSNLAYNIVVSPTYTWLPTADDFEKKEAFSTATMQIK